MKNQDKTMKNFADEWHKKGETKEKSSHFAGAKKLTKKCQKCPFLTDFYF